MLKSVLIGILLGVLIAAGSAAAACNPSWACSPWFPCENGYQQRTCNDGCGNTTVENAQCSHAQPVPSAQNLSATTDGVTVAPLVENHGFQLTAIEYLKTGDNYVFRFRVNDTGSFSERGVRLEAFGVVKEFDLQNGESRSIELAFGYNPLGGTAPVIRLRNYYYFTEFDSGVALSMHNDEALYFGQPIELSGYIKYRNSTGIATAIALYMDGRFMKETYSNNFGYWGATLAPSAPGNHEVRAEALHYLVSMSANVLANEPPFQPAAETSFRLFPSFIEMAAGGGGIVAVDVNAPDQTDLVFSGLPSGWMKTGSVSVQGQKRVYLHLTPPADSDAGVYLLNVSAVSFNGTLVNSTMMKVRIVPRQADVISGITGMVVAQTSSSLAGVAVFLFAAAAYIFWRRKKYAVHERLKERVRELESVKKKLVDEWKEDRKVRYPDVR